MDEKQVIVMRKDLHMNRGKIAAQASHACLKVFFDRVINAESNKDGNTNITIKITEDMEKWRRGPFTKICLQVNSEEELLETYKKAKEAGLPCALITDSGQTTFHNQPTNTCIAIGPADARKIDSITGNLKLMS